VAHYEQSLRIGECLGWKDKKDVLKMYENVTWRSWNQGLSETYNLKMEGSDRSDQMLTLLQVGKEKNREMLQTKMIHSMIFLQPDN